MTGTLLIVNPAAGAGRTARRWPALERSLREAGLEFDSALTKEPGHGTTLAREALSGGYRLIVAVGGDGTVNEVLNGLVGEAGAPGVTLGIISTGTGSDLIRSLGIPRSPLAAGQLLRNPRPLAIDIGRVEFVWGGQTASRYFINLAGVGIDAALVRATGRRFKRLGDKPAYLAGLLTTVFNYRNVMTVTELDGKIETQKVCEVLVCNGGYGGGGMHAAPDADPADGWFDVMTIKEMGRLELLRCFPSIYQGTHIHHPRVALRRARQITIRPAVPLPVQADGEVVGETPVRITMLPGAIKVAVPG
jgi:diacylglycerol kinase (ATP)